MDMKTKTILMWAGVAVLVVGGIVMLLLSFGGSEDNPEVDVNAIYTNAAATIVAQQQTLQSGTFVATPTPNFPTPTPPPLLSPTASQQIPTILPTIKPAGGVVATGCDSAVYVSDVTIPDGTTVLAGQSFTKTWQVKNAGSCAWTATYQLTFVSGDSLGGKATVLNKVVNPGETADISVILTSTSASGSITGRWKLTNDKGQQFGDELTVVITNGSASTTTTVTATPTPTAAGAVATSTFTPTPTTAAPTDTPVPTETPTPTPTST